MRSQKLILLAAFLFALLGLIRGGFCFWEQKTGYTEPVENYTVTGIILSVKDSAYGKNLIVDCGSWSVYIRSVQNEEAEPGPAKSDDASCYARSAEPGTAESDDAACHAWTAGAGSAKPDDTTRHEQSKQRERAADDAP